MTCGSVVVQGSIDRELTRMTWRQDDMLRHHSHSNFLSMISESILLESFWAAHRPYNYIVWTLRVLGTRSGNLPFFVDCHALDVYIAGQGGMFTSISLLGRGFGLSCFFFFVRRTDPGTRPCRDKPQLAGVAHWDKTPMGHKAT